MSVRGRQALILGVGVVLTIIMGIAGVWQMGVYQNKGHAQIVARSQQPPVALEPLIKDDHSSLEAYGIRVRVTGEYLPDEQFYIGTGGSQRVLTAFRTDSGRTLAVVRGVASGSGDDAPPSGTVTQVGVFMPGEQTPTASASGPLEPRLAAVQLGTLAQRWDPPLVSGFLTLGDDDAASQGLTPAPVQLPEGRGSTQNLSYAMQWWVFAAFALLMAVVFARQVGKRSAANSASPNSLQ